MPARKTLAGVAAGYHPRQLTEATSNGLSLEGESLS